jgi:hypothetical protein
MHIGLKKVLTWRDWVPAQNFHGHDGMTRFHDWNLRLRATWAAMRPVAVPLQLGAAIAAVMASLRARPYEAALLCGVIGMFAFNLPANYYYVVLVLVPALILRRAATWPSVVRRSREYLALSAFNVFWLATLIVARLWGDDIMQDYIICVLLGLFLLVWLAVWLQGAPLPAWLPRARRSTAVPSSPRAPA